MEFEYVGVDNELSTLKYRILSSSIDASNRNSEVEGFSGAGVFVIWIQNMFWLEYIRGL